MRQRLETEGAIPVGNCAEQFSAFVQGEIVRWAEVVEVLRSQAGMTVGGSARAPAQTLAQKLIARASGREQVAVGEIVTCGVDLAMFHDSSGPRRLQPMLEELGAQIWDRSRVVLVMDHYVPERDDDSRRIVRIARDWARDRQLPHVYDSQGICHVVVPQHGHIRPGMLCVGGDSHSPTGGAFGAYMFGIGSTEMLGVVVTGEIWLRVPETIRMWWDGALPRGRDRQGHDAVHDRPLRHERRALPGGRVLPGRR